MVGSHFARPGRWSQLPRGRNHPEMDPYRGSEDGTARGAPKHVPEPEPFRGVAVREFWNDWVMAERLPVVGDRPGDYLKEPDFMDPACVAVWEELVDELERRDMSPVEAERTWLGISDVLVLARLQLGLVGGGGAAPITVRRAAALADRAKRHSLAAGGARELAL